jgi:hypothetical protein
MNVNQLTPACGLNCPNVLVLISSKNPVSQCYRNIPLCRLSLCSGSRQDEDRVPVMNLRDPSFHMISLLLALACHKKQLVRRHLVFNRLCRHSCNYVFIRYIFYDSRSTSNYYSASYIYFVLNCTIKSHP